MESHGLAPKVARSRNLRIINLLDGGKMILATCNSTRAMLTQLWLLTRSWPLISYLLDSGFTRGLSLLCRRKSITILQWLGLRGLWSQDMAWEAQQWLLWCARCQTYFCYAKTCSLPKKPGTHALPSWTKSHSSYPTQSSEFTCSLSVSSNASTSPWLPTDWFPGWEYSSCAAQHCYRSQSPFSICTGISWFWRGWRGSSRKWAFYQSRETRRITTSFRLTNRKHSMIRKSQKERKIRKNDVIREINIRCWWHWQSIDYINSEDIFRLIYFRIAK